MDILTKLKDKVVSEEPYNTPVMVAPGGWCCCCCCIGNTAREEEEEL